MTEQKTIFDTIQELLDQIQLELDEVKNPSYCPKCNSCGITECCQPKCMYGEQHKADYRELLEENERLREALKFYAKLDNYMAEFVNKPIPTFDFKNTPVHLDSGKLARATLK